MKKYILCLMVLVGIVSCREEAVPKPDNLLSKEQMAAILYDVTLINAMKGVDRKGLYESFLHFDAYLYTKHKTDSLQFEISNNYYSANPMQYDKIYEIVNTRLLKDRKGVEEELKLEQKRRDSLQAAKKAEKKKNDTLPKPKFKQVKKQ